MRFITLTILGTALWITTAPIAAASSSGISIRGTVADTEGLPVPSASVVLESSRLAVLALSADNQGRFAFEIDSSDFPVVLTISSVGFERHSRQIESAADIAEDFTIRLSSLVIPVSGITVSPEPSPLDQYSLISQNRLLSRSRRAPGTNDPVTSVRSPDVSRPGTSHSSKIRVLGTNPAYSLNGSPIGNDPNHYGVMSILPASVIDRIEMQLDGSDPSCEVPGVLNLVTPRRFEPHFAAGADLSLLQATGYLSTGTDHYHLMTSLRKSVLDKVIDRVHVESNRRTLPPTNFQDLFLSLGHQPAPGSRVTLDHYFTQDYLAYTIPSTTGHKHGLSTYQHSDHRFLGAEIQKNVNNLLFTASMSDRVVIEQYQASPVDASSEGLRLNLHERSELYAASASGKLFLERSTVTIGLQSELSDRSTSLHQQNWNFLPPDATSDNPFIYQYEFNVLYDSLGTDFSGWNTAAYLSADHSMFGWLLSGGVRFQHIGTADQGNRLLVRFRMSGSLAERSDLTLFAGTFAESPLKPVLENYQPLVRLYHEHLRPIDTKLLSARISYDNWAIGVYAKSVDHLPMIKPDMKEASSMTAVSDNFLSLESSGRLRFVGGNVSAAFDSLMDSRLSVYGFYGYARASRTTSGVTVPYELQPGHQLFVETEYRLSNSLVLGADLSVRSGNPYTPSYIRQDFAGLDRYSDQYYQQALSLENSRRFPTSLALNLCMAYTFGNKEIFCSISNATNHANPIINTSDGYIYDAGILPSVGFKWTF